MQWSLTVSTFEQKLPVIAVLMSQNRDDLEMIFLLEILFFNANKTSACQ